MDEKRYLRLTEEAFHRIEDAFEEVDPDLAEVSVAGDVLTITYRGGSRCVVNTQRPTRQIWLAARSRGWHFDFDEESGAWLDDHGAGMELYRCVEEVTRETVGLAVTVRPASSSRA
ncbi:MAG: iron donor protein CyaY [Deltaproteobacteria bacterium]|nr:iron donor protein CyaY [Deltaproteobacteria bacterium]